MKATLHIAIVDILLMVKLLPFTWWFYASLDSMHVHKHFPEGCEDTRDENKGADRTSKYFLLWEVLKLPNSPQPFSVSPMLP